MKSIRLLEDRATPVNMIEIPVSSWWRCLCESFLLWLHHKSKEPDYICLCNQANDDHASSRSHTHQERVKPPTYKLKLLFTRTCSKQDVMIDWMVLLRCSVRRNTEYISLKGCLYVLHLRLKTPNRWFTEGREKKARNEDILLFFFFLRALNHVGEWQFSRTITASVFN